MIKKVRHVAAQTGLGIGTVYCFFLIPSIAELFQPTFLILLKQALSLGFAICLGISPQSLVDLGSSMAPKIITFFKIFFTNDKQDNNGN